MGIVLDQDHAKKVIQIDDINKRIMMIKLDTVPVKTTVIQVYIPSSNSKDEEVITLYEIAEEIMGNNGNDNIIMMVTTMQLLQKKMLTVIYGNMVWGRKMTEEAC